LSLRELGRLGNIVSDGWGCPAASEVSDKMVSIPFKMYLLKLLHHYKKIFVILITALSSELQSTDMVSCIATTILI